MDRTRTSGLVTVSNRARHIDTHPAEELIATVFSVVPTQVLTAGQGPNGAQLLGPDKRDRLGWGEPNARTPRRGLAIEMSADSSMGYTGALNDAQLDDLEAFLKSL